MTFGGQGRVEHDRVKRLPGRLWSYSSGDFKQQGTSAYNLNVLSMNCEQDWKVAISVMATVQIQFRFCCLP